MQKLFCLAVFIFVLGIMPAAHTQNGMDLACTQEQFYTAQYKIDPISTWSDLYNSFDKYWQCDHDEVAIKYSRIVNRLLLNWDQISEFNTMNGRNPQFGEFVIRHLGCHVPQQQLTFYIDNATKRCPKGARDLCQSIIDRAQAPVCDKD